MFIGVNDIDPATIIVLQEATLSPFTSYIAIRCIQSGIPSK